MSATTFKERGQLKKRLNNRLKSDGCWDAYNELRAHLKQAGVNESEAWLVAAFPFPPKDSAAAEIVDHPMYAEIAAGWANGHYKFSDAATTANATGAEDVEEALLQPGRQRDRWVQLAEQVGDRKSDELSDIRWVMANYLTDASRLVADDIPSTSALAILSWAQQSPSNFGDLLRTHNTKLLPDKKTLEHEARFKDTGQDLGLLELDEEIERYEAEELAKRRDHYLSLGAEQQNQFKQLVQTIDQANARLGEFVLGGELFLKYHRNSSCNWKSETPIVGLFPQLTAWDKAAALNIESQ